MKTIKHNEGMTELGPILPYTSPEMRVFWKRYVEERPQDFPISRWNYVEKFNDWYNELEAQNKIWMDNLHSGEDKYREDHLHPRIAEKVKSIEKGRFILDIGCGPGNAVIPHLKPNQHYLGLDVSRVALEYATEKYEIPLVDDEEVPDFNQERMLRFGSLPNAIPLNRGGIFDEVISSMVLHHVPDLRTSLETITKMLHPGGNYFIVNFDSGKRKEIDGFFKKIHYRDEQRTVGDYNLPQGRLTNVTVNFHDNEIVFKELKKYSDFIHLEECGEIFQIFEGIKKRK
ncbi:class I SAM-dependent methyltransferase [Candidatus Pacearchaeota archaeon]|nr:class I SAM-dependent methyltransferase [Candidatus Pacearchaeota archaeon]